MTKELVLFFAPFLSGLLIFVFPAGRMGNFRLLLVFAGSYLFSITVSHLLPELYRRNDDLHMTALFVLGGFFLQQILEYFTSGVEHGHVHGAPHHHGHEGHEHHHHHGALSSVFLLIALCLHAFLEGAMLAQPLEAEPVFNMNAVLAGIALHRAPAAFALMTVLSFDLGDRRKALPYLFLFSIAAPLGLWLSHSMTQAELLGEKGLMYLYALVCGNFLHISTTIVLESSPEHRFNPKKLGMAIAGAIVAVFSEMFF